MLEHHMAAVRIDAVTTWTHDERDWGPAGRQIRQDWLLAPRIRLDVALPRTRLKAS